MRTLRPATALTVAVMLGANAAAAAKLVSFEAPEGCSSPGAFSSELSRRLDAGATIDWEVRVVLTSRSGRVSGRIELLPAGQDQLVRRVVGESCAEVSSALALVGALLINQETRLRAPRNRASRPRFSTPAPRASSQPEQSGAPAEQAVRGSTPAVSPQAPAPIAAVVSLAPVPAPSPGVRSNWTSRAGVTTFAAWGPAPQALLGAGVFLDVGSLRPEVWAPWFRVSLLASSRQVVNHDVGQTHFRWAALRGEVCPVGTPAARFTLRACVAIEGGAVEAGGLAGALVADVATRRRLWLAVPVVAQGELRLARRLRIQPRLGASVPLRRDSFDAIVDGGAPATLHRSPALAAFVEVAFGWVVAQGP